MTSAQQLFAVKNEVKIYSKDALEFLSSVDDATVDVVVADPPYWTLDRWRNIGTTTRLGGHRSKDEQREEMFFETVDREYLWNLFLELDRVLKMNGHLYMFCDDQVAPILLNWVREAKDEHRFEDAHMLIWDKVNQGMGYHYRRRYECIIFAYRGKRKLADLGIPDILTCKRVVNSYPTEKPVGVLRTLISQSLRPGETILDPFAGSGSTGAAVPPDMGATILLNDKSERSIEHMRTKTFALSLCGVKVNWLTTDALADESRAAEVAA
jgi:site-specific DNA-methyltransferase (adenine-specific)